MVLALIAAIAVGEATAATTRATFRTPNFPTGLAQAFGSMWVTTHRSGVVYRIDPATNKVTNTISVADSLCGNPVTASSKLWVGGCDSSSAPREGWSYEIDPKTNAVIRRIRGEEPVSGAGSIWTVGGRSLYRIDPRSGVVLTAIRVPGAHPDAETEWGSAGVTDGSIWALTDKTVVRISTTTDTVTNIIPLPGVQNAVFASGYTGGSYLATLDNQVWLAQYPYLYRIDPSSNVATSTGLKVGPFDQWGDNEITAAQGSLWVRTTDNQVIRIGPDLNVQRRYPATGGGGAIAVAYGSLWIDNAGTDTTWREPLD